MRGDGSGGLPQLRLDRRRALLAGLFVVAAIAVLYVALPRLAGLDATWNRLDEGQPAWLAAALAFEVVSFASYVVLFRAVFAREDSPIGRRASYQITMAGLAATRLLATGGAGGIALTVWALRRSGLSRRRVAVRMTAFLVLLYAVFMGALLLFGTGLSSGALAGPDPFGLTVVPALFGAVVIVAASSFAAVPPRLGEHRSGRVLRRLATVPATVGDGVREAIRLLRTRDWRLAGALGWWAFDVAVLWSCLRAFGSEPPIAVVVMAYFVGMLGNLLPLPGGIGGVDGGMIGALIGFGVPGGEAIVGVLAYRAFAFWLPTIPGVVAYVQLLRTVRTWEHRPEQGGAVHAIR